MNEKEECNICYDLPLKENDILSCGHRIHISCIQKQFKSECPLCRAPLNIKVFGKKPEPDISLFEQEEKEIHQGNIMGFPILFLLSPGIIGDVVEREYNQILMQDEEPWREKGYQYAEEDSEYDDENPHGDSWDYEDV